MRQERERERESKLRTIATHSSMAETAQNVILASRNDNFREVVAALNQGAASYRMFQQTKMTHLSNIL